MKKKSITQLVTVQWKAKCEACSYKSDPLNYSEASEKARNHTLATKEHHKTEVIKLEFTCRRLNCTQLCEPNQTICERCKKKDKARKRAILKRQRAIGIKTRRRKPKVEWKEKPQEQFVNPSLNKLHVRRGEAGAILLNRPPKEEWKPISKGYLTRLQNRGEIIVWS